MGDQTYCNIVQMKKISRDLPQQRTLNVIYLFHVNYPYIALTHSYSLKREKVSYLYSDFKTVKKACMELLTNYD